MQHKTIVKFGEEHRIYSKRVRVNRREFVWWSGDHEAENVEYLQSLTTDYPRYKISVLNKEYERWIRLKDGKYKEKSRRLLSVSLRQIYTESMEHLLALLFAYLESPEAIPIWMSKYKNSDIKEIASKLQTSGYPNPTFLGNNPILQRISDAIISDIGRLKVTTITSLDLYTFSASFCTVLDFILLEYDKDSLHHEYNSIKHGYRADGRVAEFGNRTRALQL